MLIEESVTENIKSGKYYLDAREWYQQKYILPYFELTVIKIITAVLTLIFIILGLNIYSLYPLKVRRSYVSTFRDGQSITTPQIIQANFQSSELQSINYLLVKNYVINREAYQYDKLKDQLIFMKNNSTKLLFNDFYEGLVLTNPNSIILKFKKDAKRVINIGNIKFLEPNRVAVNFTAKATNEDNQLLEDSAWNLTLGFESSMIDITAPPNSRFNFIVTSYNLKQANK